MNMNTSESSAGFINVVKIGGNIIDDRNALLAFLKDFAAMKEQKS